MAITLTSNYQETLAEDTVAKIEELKDELYALDSMLEFIDEYNERAFNEHYEEYVRCGEAIGFEAVDALASENGIDYIEGCDERYQGCYNDVGEFAEEFCDQMGYSVPDFIVVDWEETWERNLRYDFTACSDGTSYRSCHVFRDC